MTTANHPWGRVDPDGTVYVRTADGERVIGSWQAGSPEEALAFFQRKYESLETEVSLLEQRLSSTDLSPAQAQASVERLRKTIVDAHALGDLDGLCGRLDKLTGVVGHKREEVKAAREQARHNAREIKERIVDEAEHIAAEATHWKSSGERMRELLEEWKAAPHAERAVEAALWKRLSAARNSFTKRRKAYFASLEEQREDVRVRKERLVADAESLATSTAWGPTAGTFRDLMRAWKAAGPGGPGRRGGAVGPVQGGPGHVLHRARRGAVGEGSRAARARGGQAGTAGAGAGPAAGDRHPGGAERAARHPGEVGADRRRAARFP